MRISDWSSDVCSSDLSVGTGRMARDAGDFRRFMASPEADGAVLATAAALRQVRKMGEGDSTDLLIVGLAATDYVGHGTRSEEHTSELQSLMRISYAVFCLKKKKKDTTKIHKRHTPIT